MAASTGKKGGKKIGRSLRSPSHNLYTSQRRWAINKQKKLVRHLKAHPNDKVARGALE